MQSSNATQTFSDALQLRAAGADPASDQAKPWRGLPLNEQEAALRPTGPRQAPSGTAVQRQEASGEDSDLADQASGYLSRLETATGMIADHADVLHHELLVRHRAGELARGVAWLQHGATNLNRHFGRANRYLGVYCTTRQHLRQLTALHDCMEGAAAIPIDPDEIADDPRGALAGYTSYFTAAGIVCDYIAEIPGLGRFGQAAATLMRAIPNAINRIYGQFDRYHHFIERRVFEDSREADLRFGPDEEAQAEGRAIMHDIRHAEDVGYERIPDRVAEILEADYFDDILTSDAKAGIRGRSNALRRQVLEWVLNNARGEVRQIADVRFTYDRYQRFMLAAATGTGDIPVDTVLALQNSVPLAMARIGMGS